MQDHHHDREVEEDSSPQEEYIQVVHEAANPYSHPWSNHRPVVDKAHSAQMDKQVQKNTTALLALKDKMAHQVAEDMTELREVEDSTTVRLACRDRKQAPLS